MTAPEKPPLPANLLNPLNPFPRIPVNSDDGSPFAHLLQLAVFCADGWTLGPDGPYKKPLTASDTTRGQMREALLHLLELGFIDIDEERMYAAPVWPTQRETDPAALPLGEEA